MKLDAAIERTPMIDPNQLAAWRKLCEEATPEPWKSSDKRNFLSPPDGEWAHIEFGPGDWGGFYITDHSGVNRLRFSQRIVQTSVDADADFIAAARTALPQLLDEVEALQRRVAELEAEVARLRGES